MPLSNPLPAELPAPEHARAAVAAGLPPVPVEGAVLAELRSMALSLADGTAWSRLDDHEVMAQLKAAAHRLGLRQAMPPLRRLVPPPVEGAPPPPPPAAAPRAAASAPAPAESSFASGLDPAAMVAVLEQAARDGTPLCEECLREAAETPA